MNTRPRLHGSVIAAVAFLGLPLSNAFSQIQFAEDLLVNLDAATYTNGTPWANSGSLGGAFAVGNAPLRENNFFGATAAVSFGGTDFFTGPASTATLHDANANYSIEVWAFNPVIDGEESLVSWGKRGGPDGSNVSMNYGSDSRWGSMGHWGGADLGWGTNSNPVEVDPKTPTAGEWHHLVYRYNGAGFQSVFVDGLQRAVEGGLSLDPADNVAILIGSQTEGDGVTPTGALRLSGAISKVRIHSGTISYAQVVNNYNLEASSFGRSLVTTQLLGAGPVNRYTFNNLGGAAAGTVIPDVVGSANGVIRGAGAVPSGSTGLDLPGGDPASTAYVDLPNGIISSKASISIEAWVTVQGSQNWSRIFDFGTGTAGEITDVGGGSNGTDYIMLSGTVGTGNDMRIERLGGPQPVTPADTTGNSLGTEMHVVATYNDATDTWAFYRDGSLMSSFVSIGGPNTVVDVNNWLGRSQWTGDSNLDGVYNEFRIYDYALTPNQVIGNTFAGPDVVNVPEPGSIALLGAAAATLGLRRRRKV